MREITNGVLVEFKTKEVYPLQWNGYAPRPELQGPKAVGRVVELGYSSCVVETADGRKWSVEFNAMTGIREMRRVMRALKAFSDAYNDFPKLAKKQAQAAKKAQETAMREAETSTCPCCFGRFVAKDAGSVAHKLVPANAARMVLHGFQRPGWGHTVGSCIGVGYEPYEASPLGTIVMRDRLIDMIKGVQKRLAELNAGTVETLSYTENEGWGRQRKTVHKTVTKTQDAFLYGKILRNQIYNLESELRYMQRDLETAKRMIADWKPAPGSAVSETVQKLLSL
jgi:hypothetical protein